MFNLNLLIMKKRILGTILSAIFILATILSAQTMAQVGPTNSIDDAEKCNGFKCEKKGGIYVGSYFSGNGSETCCRVSGDGSKSL